MMDQIDNTPDAAHKKYEDFVNMAVHELKTPVTVLKAYLQMIVAQLHRENQFNYMKTADKMDLQLDKLLNLISDLQDGVNMKAESIHCLMNNFCLAEVIKACVDATKTTHPLVQIELALSEKELLVNGDHIRIEQVMHNFINNAIKYASSEPCIRISAAVQAGQILVKVIDNGVGISPDKQLHVFERFYRVKCDATTQQSGLGLGLFICAEIIRKHGGQIGLSSTEGEGSEFWFSLPHKP